MISTASFGSPGRMALRFKKGETILEVQLRHGDVATMCDTRLQALTDVGCPSNRFEWLMSLLTESEAHCDP